MFIDTALIKLLAGRGGDGCLSFRHEKFIDKGGPDGGDGGRGGDVVLKADENLNTLAMFRTRQEMKAENGEAGSKRNMHGRSGNDLVVKVPVGTVLTVEGELRADLTQHDQEVIVARGGDGGFGNAHFKSSTRQAPRIAERGEPGDEFEAKLELKLLADVGLVGFPNAGKSTFLSVVSNARPEIANYEFTTLSPNLGVAFVDETDLLIADIPGLIEGASEGKGLGDEFLRHIERTAVILHLIDAYQNDPAAAYQTIRRELENYSEKIAALPEVIALTKVEGFDEELLAHQMSEVQTVAGQESTVYALSSQAHLGVTDLLRVLKQRVETTRAAQVATQEAETPDDGITVIGLTEAEEKDAWTVEKREGIFVVHGDKIEKFARRTEFTQFESVNRLRHIMGKLGITHELLRQGAEGSSKIHIGSTSFTLVEQ